MSPETPTDPLASAVEHADHGLPAPTSSLPKRVVERLTRFLLEPQRAYNRGVIDAIRVLRADDERLGQHIILQGHDVERRTGDLRSDLTDVQLALSEDQTDGALTRGQVVELAKAVQRLERRMAELDTRHPGASED